jgi:glucosamine-6-phosphate deaminase
MKLSFSTLACPSWTLAAVIDQASRLGYDGIELRFIEDSDALWERPELQGDRLREALARLRDAGLAVSCVDTRSFFHHPDAAARRSALEEARRMAELASRLGAPGIRVFGDKVQPGADASSTRQWIAEALSELRDFTKPMGVEVWLETHGDFAAARETLGILDLVVGDGLGVVWDPANAFELGEDPSQGARELGPAIRHVHLKDLRRRETPPGDPVLMGRGEFPAASALRALGALGYDGFISLEWEKRWHPAIEPPEVALPHFLRWFVDQAREAAAVERPARRLDCAWMSVEIHPDRPSMGRAAACVVSAEIRRLVERDGSAAVIFASAPSQNEFLAALRADPEIPWPKVTAFHLDEYVGIDETHPASFRRFVRDRLLDHVPVRAFHGLDGRAEDLFRECARYASLIEQERPSLAILGIGENGHLAFIDPPVCSFAEAADVRVVELDEPCRWQQVHDGCFPAIDAVPRTALSLTVPLLMRVPRAVAIVPGPAKRTAVKAAIEGPVTAACPASMLRRHRNATLLLDEASAADLRANQP